MRHFGIMIVVSDTSVLTSLIQIARLALLRDLYGSVLTPRAVHQELLRSHSHLPEFIEVCKEIQAANNWRQAFRNFARLASDFASM